ncbi:hypothetical protein H9L10_08595 [Phycicoccus endophyticus]|uniref:DUF8094 domain-containing protein n=1 Tax=Phycicoccus endophyticus TaxID=1690220 RepID=A0A7G9QYI1_9MICO|nr:hypothetical protein [Phycicoccus endophyticus]NHI19306.1 hypothetical protein [Phycicoccus endophyticus]QNN48406.1 hypothetical protein H9L10_08595 [Phycicoccus endophyticus]GGL41698.1 hypothetical protein GCM10012283_25410 [Phycicoccus endophyticus]
MTRPTRRLAVLAAATGLALGAAGCGATDALVGRHAAPTERTAAAPLDAEGATAVASRLLGAAQAAATATGKKGHAARAEVLAGDALTVADTAAARGLADDATEDLARGPEPTVLAQSQGRSWPRAILATTLEKSTSTQYLHVMVSRAAAKPYRIEASVPMLGGAEVPSLGEAGAGAPLVEVGAGKGLVMSPGKAFAAYARALARPAPKKTPAGVVADDPFATALRESATAQAKALGKLATLRQKHVPDLDHALAFRLADGGVVAFGLLRRTDTITAGSDTQELTLPKRYAALVGTKTVESSVRLTSLEPVVLVVPTTGKVEAVGASELLSGGSGS